MRAQDMTFSTERNKGKLWGDPLSNLGRCRLWSGRWRRLAVVAWGNDGIWCIRRCRCRQRFAGSKHEAAAEPGQHAGACRGNERICGRREDKHAEHFVDRMSEGMGTTVRTGCEIWVLTKMVDNKGGGHHQKGVRQHVADKAAEPRHRHELRRKADPALWRRGGAGGR